MDTLHEGYLIYTLSQYLVTISPIVSHAAITEISVPHVFHIAKRLFHDFESCLATFLCYMYVGEVERAIVRVELITVEQKVGSGIE